MNKISSEIKWPTPGAFNLYIKREKADFSFPTFIYNIKSYNSLFTNIFSIFVYGS